ncbi:MAG TPA: T9SS type A sorting domain-containing protein [Bacteroidales bacterium]|nr:T9SS type A sorting domain-containing protein [Bacteroidales bacterium]
MHTFIPAEKIAVDLPGVAPGVYFISVRTRGRELTKKIMID